LLGVDAHEDMTVLALFFLFAMGRRGSGLEVTVFVFDICIVGSSLSCLFVI